MPDPIWRQREQLLTEIAVRGEVGSLLPDVCFTVNYYNFHLIFGHLSYQESQDFILPGKIL